jgi:hypothetical protein
LILRHILLGTTVALEAILLASIVYYVNRAWAGHGEIPRATIAACLALAGQKPRGQWIGHIVGAIIALFLIWWMLRVFVL